MVVVTSEEHVTKGEEEEKGEKEISISEAKEEVKEDVITLTKVYQVTQEDEEEEEKEERNGD